MKNKAYLLVFNGLADWEASLAMCEIRKQPKYDVVTVGFTRDPIVSMAGLRITPEIRVDDVDIENACIFVLPGGDMWEKENNLQLEDLLYRLHRLNVPIAAICGATLAVARAGLLIGTHHTSNTKEYLKNFVPGYREEEMYVDTLAVSDKNIITASGVGSVEFAFEIIKALDIYTELEKRVWFDLFKNGVIPGGMGYGRKGDFNHEEHEEHEEII